MKSQQRTLAAAVVVEGVGLFSARPVRVEIVPSPSDSGLVFERVDLDATVRIPARVDRVAPADHRTALQEGATRIETVEHCLAALVGMGVDNAVIRVDGPELPIGDGSCALFVEPIHAAGVVEQDAMRSELIVREPLEIQCDTTGARIHAAPCENGDDAMHLRYELDYGDRAPIAAHHASYCAHTNDFRTEIAFARTFSTQREAEAARAMGLFAHLSPREMLVIGPDGPIENTLRAPDEPARHKVIDMIGDLALAGARIRGRITGHRSGHTLNHALARALVEQNA